ncbi:MAG: RNA polymerase sigma factor [Candidatus Limnocylindria bacterium]
MQRREKAERWSWLAAQGDGLVRLLRSRFGADAEDLAQEAIVRAGASDRPVPTGAQGVAWLRRVARNAAIDRWRRHRRSAPLELAQHVAVHPDADGRIDIEAALGRLSRGDRHVLGLIATGMRYADIARAEGVDAAVIRQRVGRARARLIALLMEGDR